MRLLISPKPKSNFSPDHSNNFHHCFISDLNELCVRSADMQSPTIFTCDSTNRTNAHCYVECSTNWGLALAPQTDEISCDSGAITPNFVPDCSGQSAFSSVFLLLVSKIQKKYNNPSFL